MALTKAQKQQIAENEKVLSESFPALTPDQIKKLQNKLFNIGCKAKRNAENLCDIDGYEDKRESIRAEVVKLSKKFGIEFSFKVTGDPRGYCLKVILPSGKYNTWGGSSDGWGFGE